MLFLSNFTTVSLPHFLGIGAMKAGTTWLDHNLRRHPEVWLPPMKEIRYFRNGMLEEKPKRNVRRLTKFVQPSVRKTFFENPAWTLRYFLGKQTDEWYASLFQPEERQICGEISPDYAKLTTETVEYIHNLMPDIKIIFLLRNPIDRAWSHILWDFHGGDGRHNLQSLDIGQCKRHAERKSSRIRGDYLRTIGAWQAHYPKERFFVGFFEDIRHDPDDLLARIESFLGVSTVTPKSAGQKVNATPGPPMPPELRRHLAALYADEIRALAQAYGGPARQWHAEAENLLS